MDWDDELVVATLLTKEGAIVHPAFVQNTDSENVREEAGIDVEGQSGEVEADGGDNTSEIEQVNEIENASEVEQADEIENTGEAVVAEGGKDADDLTRINGIGPTNAGKLIEAGVSSFAQIAAWSSEEEEEFGERFAFPGRVEREEWVKQAKQLIDEEGS